MRFFHTCRLRKLYGRIKKYAGQIYSDEIASRNSRFNFFPAPQWFHTIIFEWQKKQRDAAAMLRGVTGTLAGKILREHSFVHHEPRTRGAAVPLVDADAIGPAARVTRDDRASSGYWKIKTWHCTGTTLLVVST